MAKCSALALTGGIGCGKSAACACFRDWGIPVFSADDCVRALLEGDAEVFGKIERRWGRAVVGAQGRLDRARIAERVFADKRERLFLEKLLHPRVRAACRATARKASEENRALFVAEIPLLFENGFDKMFDASACLWTNGAVARERLRARGLSDTQIEARRAAQWPLEKKAAAADFVVLNDGSLEFLRAQLRCLQQRLFLA